MSELCLERRNFLATSMRGVGVLRAVSRRYGGTTKAGWIDLNVIMSYMHWPGEPAWTERLALRRLNNAKKAGVMEKWACRANR